MKRLLIVACILLIFSAPALAQDTSTDPAAYLPARTPFYIELRGEAGINVLETLINLNNRNAGLPESSLRTETITPLLNDAFPGASEIDFQTDVLSWAGDRIGIAMTAVPLIDATQAPDMMLVLPIRDPAGAQAFVQRVASSAAPEDAGGVQLYRGNELSLAVGTSVMWLSTHAGIDSLFSFGAPEHLTQNPAYAKIRAALPADAPLAAYISGRYLSGIGGALENFSLKASSLSQLWQTLLRLHPAQSAAEDALLASPNLNGIGAAARINDNILDITALLSLDAQYPAPTLPTATAGSTLLDLIPDDSIFAFASYDFTAALLSGGLAAAWVTPVRSEVISEVVNTLPEMTPDAVPAATTTPITVESIIAQVQPVIRQAESTLGISLGELYRLLNGEYALAAFPNIDQQAAWALYIQSSDPQRVIAALETASRLILTSPSPPVQWFTLESANVGGVDVAFISGQGLDEKLAFGVLNNNTLFITPESALQTVLLAATSDTTASTPILDAQADIAGEQEAFFYAESMFALGNAWGSLDVRENGLFALHLSAALGE